MMSISKWQSSSQAENYFQKDLDYYQKNQELGEWFITREMAERYSNIEHQSAITKESYQDFSDLINQNLKGNATGEQRAGFDITFSPSKSVDVIYTVASEDMKRDILKAQDRAVNIALERASEYITYRMRTQNGREHFQNNGLAIAKFQHLSNRNEEVKIHTHCFIANQTVNSKGELVSIDNKQLYDNQKLITQIYHQELFQELQKLGFASEVLDIQKDIIEIKGVSQEAKNAISTRTLQIEEWLSENRAELMGKYPNANESQLRQIATLETRNYKQSHSYSELSDIEQRNRELVEAAGFTQESILSLQNNKSEEQKSLNIKELIEKAAAIVTEQESTFTKEELLSRAIKLNAIQGYSYDMLELEVAIFLKPEIIEIDKNVYSTQEMIDIEQSILSYAKESHSTKEAETTQEQAEQFLNERYSGMTTGQKAAFTHLLTSKDAVSGIFGDAGTGKTYMLKAVKEFQELHQTDNLIGLAPTNKAAGEISKESGIKGQTIDSFIAQKEHKDNQIIIVDEASMLDSRKMKQLVSIAAVTNSKLVLMGDTKQFTSIGAGAIFEQLSSRGAIKTAIMDESMRAKTDEMRELYKLTKEQRTDDVLDILERKQQFNTINDNSYDDVVKEYLQNKDDTLLLVMKNETRKELNELIREELKASNQLSNHSSMVIQEKQQLDSISAHHHSSYIVGDSAQIMESFKGGFKSGTEAIITVVNEENNSVTLQDKNGKSKEISLSEHGDKLSLFKKAHKEFSQGEKIIFTKKDKSLGLNNGDIATVKDIKDGIITVDVNSKREVKINTKEYNYIDHAYAITNHKAQGQTSERAIFVGDSRLSNQNAFYVALTRAKTHISVFTQDKEQFRDAVSQRQRKKTTLDYIKLNQELKQHGRAREIINNIVRSTASKLRSIASDIRDTIQRTRGREQVIADARRDIAELTKDRAKVELMQESIKKSIDKVENRINNEQTKEEDMLIKRPQKTEQEEIEAKSQESEDKSQDKEQKEEQSPLEKTFDFIEKVQDGVEVAEVVTDIASGEIPDLDKATEIALSVAGKSKQSIDTSVEIGQEM
ncbi:MAG: MobF family relaxase [Sulfurimonadaceae bacterium]|nr:MobF family relaxase [Sulfurimonadaceae bacterium]